jgi:hypothetical protein
MTTETEIQAWKAQIDLMRPHWGPGPWDDEPDREEWRTEAGLPALIQRGPIGALCGYVAVPPGHPWHGLERTDVPDEAHDASWGGVNYAARCAGSICHVPEPGEPDDVWWLGFDAGHYNDITPIAVAGAMSGGMSGGLAEAIRESGGSYKSIGFMRERCEDLARVAAEARQ